MPGTDRMILRQQDGGWPTTLAAGSAPGETGVSVLSMHFQGCAHFSAIAGQHMIWFQTSARTRFHCRIDGRELAHAPPIGSLAICPAGAEAAADAEESIDAIVIMVDPSRLALAAAEDAALGAQLIGRLSGYDQVLLDLGRELVRESAGNYPSGALYWNGVADSFMSALIARHSSRQARVPRAALGKDVLDRLRDYVLSHLDGPIDVATLAAIAGRSPFHFSRVFARSVGITPHRYVVHLRLQRAIEFIRAGRSGLADVAALTGFADQSHLSRWARRVYGVPLTQLAASGLPVLQRQEPGAESLPTGA